MENKEETFETLLDEQKKQPTIEIPSSLNISLKDDETVSKLDTSAEVDKPVVRLKL